MRGLALIGTLLLAGCEPSLGECDEDEAYTVVYDRCGRPSYVGQALIRSSCGNAAFCHSRAAEGSDRNGAPRGLDWDMAPATNADDVETLRRGQRNITSNAHLAWKMIDSDTMPPRGGEERQALADSARWHDYFTDEAIGQINRGADNDLVRNWLACGAPVVERAYPPDAVRPATTVGDARASAPPSDDCAPEPNWHSIWTILIQPTCVSCHNSEPGNEFIGDHHLDMSTETLAYDSLVGVPAMGDRTDTAMPTCETTGLDRIAPNDPDASLLYRKIAATAEMPPPCGSPMPFRFPAGLESFITDPVREWIEAGAPR